MATMFRWIMTALLLFLSALWSSLTWSLQLSPAPQSASEPQTALEWMKAPLVGPLPDPLRISRRQIEMEVIRHCKIRMRARLYPGATLDPSHPTEALKGVETVTIN